MIMTVPVVYQPGSYPRLHTLVYVAYVLNVRMKNDLGKYLLGKTLSQKVPNYKPVDVEGWGRNM